MKTETQLRESIDRFQRLFWDRKPDGRPPVGVVNTDIYLPVKYLREPFRRSQVEPEDVEPGRIRTDYEFAFANRPVNCDDWIPFAAPWRAIPWLEAWCGCPVHFSSGSLAPGPILDAIGAVTSAQLPSREAWFSRLEAQTRFLVETVPADCWVSPTILRGASDVLAALRGLPNFLCDLYDAPAAVAEAASCIHRLFLRALDRHFSLVKPKLGGYGHIFGYWAPGPTIAIQEDALGLCRPAVYRDTFMQLGADVVRHLGPYVIFHLHSTGYRHYEHVLEVPGLAGLQVTLEANGPPLADLLPMFRKALERSRLMLFADHRYEELAAVLPRLPTDGLYVVVPERFITSDGQFTAFLKSVGWAGR
jgi:hypothetical protein